MEKNQPRKLQKLMIRPIVRLPLLSSKSALNFIVFDLQVLPDQVKGRDLALREPRSKNRRQDHCKYW